MKFNTDITDRKILPLSALICITTFMLLWAIKGFDTVILMHNDNVVTIKTMDYIDDETVIAMSKIDTENTEISEIYQKDNVKTIVLEDTFPVNISVDGQVLEMNTISTTVEKLLDKANITLSSEDIISVNKTKTLREETDISITRVTTSEITTETIIPYETVKRSTERLEFGETSVKTKGQDGIRMVTTKQTLYDGVVAFEDVISDEITLESTTEIIEYGVFNVNRGVTNRDGLITTVSGEKLAYSKVIDVEATAYSTETWTSKHTASGTLARVGAIAVDPRVIPLGSKLYITSTNGSWVYGIAVAEDTGGAIKGNRIDLFFDTVKECINFGRQPATVYVLS